MHEQACVRLSRVHGTEDANLDTRAKISSVDSAEHKEIQHFLRLIFLKTRAIDEQGIDLGEIQK